MRDLKQLKLAPCTFELEVIEGKGNSLQISKLPKACWQRYTSDLVINLSIVKSRSSFKRL